MKAVTDMCKSHGQPYQKVVVVKSVLLVVVLPPTSRHFWVLMCLLCSSVAVGISLQAQKFQRAGTQLRKKMWWQNFRMQIIVVGVVVLLVLVIFLLSCFVGGRNCISSNKGNAQPNYASAPATFAAPGLPTSSQLVPGERAR